MENRFIRAEDVAQELNVSKPYAYKLIRQLNEELKAKGFITIAGRVNRQFTYLAITYQVPLSSFLNTGIYISPFPAP